MATKPSTVDHLLDQLAGAGAVSAKKMFGEYGLFLDGKMFALVCDDKLFFKPTSPGRALISAPVEAPPYPGAKPCYLISGDQWDDGEWLVELARATAGALPAPRVKSKKG